MADNKIEILTSNAKQVINDYVLGTDTDFQKVENAIQELAENDISTLNWNSLENYPDRSHDYQFSYNNSDGTINIWDTESESYLSPSEFLLSEHSDRQMACDQYAQHRLQFLENTPEALRDCVSNIFQTLKDYHLDVTILSVPNKTGSLDGKDFFAFDVSGGREQIFHSQTGTSIGLKEFQETLEQLQFWDHEEDSTSDERINRILDAAADNPARLRMEVNFLFDDKIQPNGVDFDENASITWTIRGNHETETFILTRDPDTHEITAYEANHGVLNIEQLQEEASRIGVADVSLSNRVTSDEYTQLDHMQTMEKASAKATISAVTMERGLRGMGSLTWHMHGTNGQEDFSLDGNRDGSPIIRDKAGKEYDIDSMYNKLEDIGYFKTADPAPVDMYALPAREELPTYNSLFNFFPPEVRKNMDADEIKEIRASNPYYGIVDGIDMTRKTIPIHVDNATIRNLLGESYQDATIDRMSVSTQYGNYISIEGVKFGITDRIYLDGDITKKDGEKEHINAQYAIRADGVYVYSIGQDQVSSSHKIRIVTGNDAPEKMVPFDRLSLSHRKNWFANDVKARIERLEKGSPERLDQFKQTPMYKGYENYQKIQELLEESKTLVDSAKADGDKAIEELSPEKQKEYALAVHDYQEAVSAVEKIIETKFAAAVRDIVNNAVDEIKESVMLGGNMEKKFDFYLDQRNQTMDIRDKLTEYRNTKLDRIHDFQERYTNQGNNIIDSLYFGRFEDAEKAVAAFGELREEYAAYKKDCADVERVQPTIERAEKYLDLCDAIISSATKQDAFSKRDMGQFLADHGPMQTLREYLYFEARFPMGCDMRDYASALKDSLRNVDKLEVQEKVDAYNERQTDSAYKLHIGDDGGIYTSFGYRISYDYHDTTRNVMHYYTEREDGNTYMQIDAPTYYYKESENKITTDVSNGHIPVSSNAPLIGREVGVDYTNAWNALRYTLPESGNTTMADILESVRRDFLGSKSANQYDYIRKDMDVIGHPVERYRPIIDDILKSEKSYTFDEIKEKFMDLKENTMDKVEKNTPENSTADSEKSESGIEKNRQYNLMTRAEVNLEGQLHLTQEKVEALEVQAEKIASSKGTSIEVEKGNLIQETFEKIKPYLSGLKELQGKMEGMQDRIGDSRLLRSNTFYQDYKMQYDFCAKKALDLGAAYGKDQVIKNYISNNDLRMDRQEYYKTNYYISLEQRILSGGQEGLEKYETENGKSYTYGTKYDLSAWEKVGNFFASTIFRPYFRNIEKTIDRDPHAKVAYETVPAVEKPEENPVDTSSMVSGGAQGGVTTENQAADGMDSKNSEESGALADEKKAEEEQHMDLKDAIERENQDTKDDAMVAEQTRMESQDNDQDNMTEAANSKDNSESVVNGEEVHEIPESDVLETAEISSADEDVTADFEISQSRDEPESDSGAMPESLDVQDRQEELLIGSVGEDHSDSDSFSTADAKNDTFEPTTDDATLERGESQAESPTIGSENANSFHEEYKAQFSDCLNAANALDDVLSQAIEDVFSDENLGYMDIVNAAADAITDHYNSDTPYSEAAESSADLVYEVTDLDGKPMDNMDTMAEKLQQNGLSAEHVDHLYELASDRYASPEEPFEQPDPYEGFMDLDSGVTDSVDRVDMSQSSSVDAQQKLDFYEPNQFLDQMSNDLDSYVQAIEHAENIGTDVPDTALSDIVGSSFSVDSLKSAIDLMEAEVKSTADDDRDAQETMDTDPVLSEDIPESSIEPEVDDSLDADEWRRYL